MAISGLVITLDGDERRADEALAALAADRRLELGARDGRRLAAVAETASPREDRRLWDRLHAEPGVTHVDVVWVGLDDPAEEPEA